MLDKELNEIIPTQEPQVAESPEPVAPTEQPAEPPAPIAETRQAKNFKAMREKAERIERERDEYFRRLQEIEASRTQQPIQKEEAPTYNPDDYVEGKHLNEMQKKMVQLEKKLATYEQTSAASIAEARLKVEYPDYYKVVNDETLAMFSTLEPELAETLKASPANIYSKAVTAYKMIQKLGIAEQTTQDYSSEKKRIEQNMSKPRPSNVLNKGGGHAESPLTHVNAFTDTITEDEKKQLYKQMLESRKRVG